MDNTGSIMSNPMMMMGNNMQNQMMGNNFQNPMMDNNMNNMQNQMMGNNFQNQMMNNNMNNMQNPMMDNNMNNLNNPMMGNNMQNQMMGNNNQNPMQMMNNLVQAAMFVNTINNMRQNAEMIKKSMNNANIQMDQNPQSLASPNDSLSVTFQTKDENNFNPISITVQCLAGDKVSKLIENYRIKSQDYDTTKKFIYNAHSLDPSKTCIESGLTNNGIIYVIATKHIKGA